ncbi:sporulation-specific protein 75 [Trichomonascus vanleenenianus]|uniref:sporulation-specific protein 75 n=1 Tax=Trichomonascus vanleenenianus TaxID=2268995 RepID=UPI003ECB1E4D
MGRELTDLLTSIDAGSAQKHFGTTFATFLSSLSIAAGVFLFQVLGFCCLRKRFRRIYEPRTYIVPQKMRVGDTGHGLFDWLWELFGTPLEDIKQSSGLDAFFFLRYLKFAIFLFIIGAIVLLPVLLPLNHISNDSHNEYLRSVPSLNEIKSPLVNGSPNEIKSPLLNDSPNEIKSPLLNEIRSPLLNDVDEIKGLDKLSWIVIWPERSAVYTVHLVLAVAYIVLLFVMFYKELKFFVRVRHDELLSKAHQLRASASTVYIKRLPEDYTSVAKINELFSLFPGGIRRVWINRDYSELTRLQLERDNVLNRLERAETQIAKHAMAYAARKDTTEIIPVPLPTHRLPLTKKNTFPFCYARHVETVPWCKERLERLNSEISILQAKPDQFQPLTSCFIRFNSQLAAHLACQASIFPNWRLVENSLAEIDPRSVIWRNIALGYWQERFLRLAAHFLTVLLIVGWAVPIGLITMISNLDNLSQLVPWMGFVSSLPPILTNGASRLLSPLLIGALLSFVPYAFRRIAILKGCATESQVELDVQKTLFVFFFTQLFLVITISNGFTNMVYNLLQAPVNVPKILAVNLPKGSNFFLFYLTVQGLSGSGNALFQLDRLVQRLVVGAVVAPRLTPRAKFARITDFAVWNWGAVYPHFTNLFAIAIVYSMISPVILLFASIAFGLSYCVFKYRIMYCNVTTHESYGKLYPKAIFQLFSGIYCLEICITGLFIAAESPAGSPLCLPHAAIMALLFCATMQYHWYLRHKFSPLLDSIPVASGVAYTNELVSLGHIPGTRSEADVLGSAIFTVENQLSSALQHSATVARRVSSAISSSSIASFLGVSSSPNLGNLFDELEMDLCGLTEEQRDHVVEQAFQHPAVRRLQPCVWLPKDSLGIMAQEISDIQRHFSHISASSDGCELQHDGKILVTKAPPDYDLINKMSL